MKTRKAGMKKIRTLGHAIKTDTEMTEKEIIERLNRQTVNFLKRAQLEKNRSEYEFFHPNGSDVLAEEYRKTATALNIAARELERMWIE